jgi:hypothetical protein
MSCPNSKNRPKKGLYPLGVKDKVFIFIGRLDSSHSICEVTNMENFILQAIWASFYENYI